MAVRLNVLILSPGGGSHFQAQCDDCIGQLLGLPGLDVTLLERLPIAGDATTEALALGSIGGHIACLAWQDPDAVLAGLAMAGKPMVRRSHTHDPTPPTSASEVVNGEPTSMGRMFFFDMRNAGLSQTILPSLQSLLKTLQVPMFQIAGIAKPTRSASGPSPSPTAPPIEQPASESAHPDSSNHSVAASPGRNGKPANDRSSLPPQTRATTERTGPDSVSLDRLIDEFDQLDL